MTSSNLSSHVTRISLNSAGNEKATAQAVQTQVDRKEPRAPRFSCLFMYCATHAQFLALLTNKKSETNTDAVAFYWLLIQTASHCVGAKRNFWRSSVIWVERSTRQGVFAGWRKVSIFREAFAASKGTSFSQAAFAFFFHSVVCAGGVKSHAEHADGGHWTSLISPCTWGPFGGDLLRQEIWMLQWTMWSFRFFDIFLSNRPTWPVVYICFLIVSQYEKEQRVQNLKWLRALHTCGLIFIVQASHNNVRCWNICAETSTFFWWLWRKTRNTWKKNFTVTPWSHVHTTSQKCQSDRRWAVPEGNQLCKWEEREGFFTGEGVTTLWPRYHQNWTLRLDHSPTFYRMADMFSNLLTDLRMQIHLFKKNIWIHRKHAASFSVHLTHLLASQMGGTGCSSKR